MRVNELRELLKDVDGELPIVLQSDPEGNDFWHLGGGEVDTPNEEYSREEYPEDVEAAVVFVVYPGYSL